MTSELKEVDRLRLEIEEAKALLHSAVVTGPAKEDYVSGLMIRLEEFAEEEPALACCLMTALWPIASELFMHDVCDGVDLWIVNNRSPVVLDHLKKLSASESNPDLKRHWDGLVSSF